MVVECDASPYGIGACLLHEYDDGSRRPVFYVSRSLTSAESHYSQIEREALAIIFAVKRLHMFLYGRSFLLRTDHKPLVKIFGEHAGLPATAVSRLQRWAVVLSEYDYRIEHVSGSSNVTADFLSRLPQKLTQQEEQCIINAVDENARDPCSSIPVSASDVATASKSDLALSKVLQYVQFGWPSKVDESMKPYRSCCNELTIEAGCLVREYKTVIPEVLRPSLLAELHSVHVGIVRMKAVARSYFWWPGIDKDIELLAKSCQQCQEVSKAPSKENPHPWIFPSEPFERVHIDYAEFHGMYYFLIVDAYSKWVDIYQLSSSTASQTVNCLLSFISTYGIPKTIISDNGPQFTSEHFSLFCRDNGIMHKCTPPYHPASNGQVERVVQELKKALRTRPADVSEKTQLYRFLFSYRNTPHSTTNVAPASLIFRKLPTTKFAFLKPNFGGSQRSRQFTSESPKRAYEPGDLVLILNMRNGTGDKWLRGVVQQRLGPVSYAVLYGDQVRHVHSDHLRLVTSDSCSSSSTSASQAVCAESAAHVPSSVVQSESVSNSRSIVFDTTDGSVSDSTSVCDSTSVSVSDAGTSPCVSESAPASIRHSARESRPRQRLIEEMD